LRLALDGGSVPALIRELERRLEQGPEPLPPGADKTGREAHRNDQTIQSYRDRAERLFNAAGVEADDYIGVVAWFAAQHFQWAPNTIVQYRAALRQAIEDAALDLDLTRRLDLSLGMGPIPRSSGAPRTSARKRKSLPHEQFDCLIRHLERAASHPDDRLVAQLLRHNVLLFLRRVEWETAAVHGEHLVIQNAKATNGRSIGPQRRRDLSDYGQPGVRNLRKLIGILKARSAEILAEKSEDVEKAEAFSVLWARLSARLARACKTLGIKRVSIYTTRHVGMANAKYWMLPEEVAASAGHKTTATATSHYAKRRSGWGAKAKRVARPVPEDVQKVIKSPKWNRKANVEYYKERSERLREDDAEPPSFSI
jgi:hypothetical protein